MRSRRRREESEGRRRDEEDGGERREGGESRSRGSVESVQSPSSSSFRIRLSLLPSLSTTTLLVGVALLMMMGGVEGLRCQCSMSSKSAHCSNELCDINPREGKVPACVVVLKSKTRHYACIRVREDEDMGCRMENNQTSCMCRDSDMCNVDLGDRVDEEPDRKTTSTTTTTTRPPVILPFKQPAEFVGDHSVVNVRAERRNGRDPDVLLDPDRDDTLGVAPSVIDFFDEESEDGVGRGRGNGVGGGLIERERESWSDEEDKRAPSSSVYRTVHGVDNGQLVPLSVKRLGEERRSKLDENVIDLTNPHYRRPPPPPPHASPTRRPDWRQPGTQPVPQGPYEAVRREEEEKRRRMEMEQRVHRVHFPTTIRSRLQPPPTTTTPPPPPPPSRPPTPVSIGHINTFMERPSPDPVPYPRRWDDRPWPPVPPSTTTSTSTFTTTTTTTEEPTTTTRKPYVVSVSRYVVSTRTTTVPTTTPTTTPSTTTTTTEPTTTSTTTEPPTTTTTTTTTTTPAPTTTVRSTVAPTMTTVEYDDMDGGEEEGEEEGVGYVDVVLPAGTKSNSVPRVGEKEPDSGTINTIWSTVVVTAVLIGALW